MMRSNTKHSKVLSMAFALVLVLGTIMPFASFAAAPALSPDTMTVYQNSGSPETIVFTLTEELNLTEGAAVTGFSVNEGAIATAVYTGKGTTNTITLTSALDGQWMSGSTTVSYTSGGNVFDAATTTEMADIVGHATLPADESKPTVTFDPLDAATDVAIDGNITITFNEAVRKLDDSELVNGDLAAMLTLKLTNNAGADVPFTATVNAGKTVITIDPTNDLMNSQAYYVAIAAEVEDAANNAINPANATFTTVADVTAPTVTFNPLDAATNVAIDGNITITFNEAVRKLDDSDLVNGDLAGILTFKLTDNAGADVPYTATINAGKTVITIDPTSNLANNQAYYVAITNQVEDTADNPILAANATFTTVKASYALTLTGTQISSNPAAGNIVEGTSVTVTVAPLAGKQVATFTVGGADQKAALAGGTPNEYTFNMPASATEVVVTYENIPNHVINITTANTLLVGRHAFTLNHASYTLNNFLIAINNFVYANPADNYHIYYYTGSAWYDIVTDPTLQTPITDLDTINGDGMYTHTNMVAN